MPEPYEPGRIDEAAEEAAAAAEAANIGGTVSDYAGPADLPATEAERPLAEAGEGEAEGQEQAELDLERAAESSEGMSDAEHQIDDTIEQAANPLDGETIEPVQPRRTSRRRRSTPRLAPPTQETQEAPAVEPEPKDERQGRGRRRRRVGLADLVRPLGQPVASRGLPQLAARARGAA